MRLDNELKILDFTPGIKAGGINANFSVMQGWIERERIRIGGYGLVEGFALSESGMTVSVGPGVYINECGRELFIDAYGHKEHLEFFPIEEECIVPEDGRLRLKYAPYCPQRGGLIFYRPPEHKLYPDKTSLAVADKNGGNVPLLAVDYNTVTVDARFAKTVVKVKYLYCDDRIDAILLHRDGSYLYQAGLVSTSPSCVELLDYKNYYLIGFVHWIVDETVSAEFIVADRTYRKVYVDGQNRLYLNGKLYKEAQVIYFEEPPNPKEDDLWYDRVSNSLCIWREKDGVCGWTVINDATNALVKEKKIWYPEAMPADLQTFLFAADETQLWYAPNVNALEIIIDNTPLMLDQFTEIVQPAAKPYLSAGIGFKLADPLDRAATVQAVVTHNVKNGALRNVFQRAAVFVDENYILQTPSNVDKRFYTDVKYAIGEKQLEVYINGRKAIRGVDFTELTDGLAIAAQADRGNLSGVFQITAALQGGDRVEYRILRHVWNYDQLNTMVDEMERKANDALSGLAALERKVENIEQNARLSFESIEIKVNEIKEKLKDLDVCVKYTDSIALAQIPEEIKTAVRDTVLTKIFRATDEIFLPGFTAADYIVLTIYNGEEKRVLLSGVDYSGAESAAGLTVNLQPEYIASGAYIHASGIAFGLK